MDDATFIEKYRRLCGHIAWDFVRRSHKGMSDVLLTQEDAEDFASCALIKLLKCPTEHRGNKWYVQRVIENAITTAWRKRLKQMGTEKEGTERSLSLTANDDEAHIGDIWDRLPGPDGLAGKTQVKFDYAAIVALLPRLPDSQRLVLELSFGLGCESYSPDRIAKKLGRTKWWVQVKYNSAIKQLREEISSQRSLPLVS